MTTGGRSRSEPGETWRTLATSATIVSPAKINLHLRVFPLRDGFHPLRSWFRTIDLADELSFEEADSSFEEAESPEPANGTIDITCDAESVPIGDDNLIARAWRRLGGEQRTPLRVTLDKRIPMGGGLGGGSSNCAATLHALSRLWDVPATVEDAAALGSDVPFFFEAVRTGLADAVVTGRGEHVAPFAAEHRHAVLLFLPGIHCSTPAVFRQFDAMPAPPDDVQPDFAEWSSLPAETLLPQLRNDLESAAFALHPTLATLRHELEEHLSRPVRMSGSGSTLFTLFDDAAQAKAAAEQVPGRLVGCVVC